MIKTSKLLKRMWVVAVSVIAITLMSVAVSFATEAQETAVDNSQDQSTIAEETAVVEEAAVPEAAILAEEVGVPSAHINLNVTDASVTLYCHHSLKVDGGEKKDEIFVLNPNDGITFENPHFVDNPEYYAYAYGSAQLINIEWLDGSNNEERFNILHTLDNQSFDVLFDEPIISEDKSTITIPCFRPNKFIVSVTLEDEDWESVGPGYEVPYYTADGQLCKTGTTDKEGNVKFELNRDQAMGYVYSYDASTNLSYFDFTMMYGLDDDLNGEEVARCDLYCELAEPQVSLSGNEHHSNFEYAFSYGVGNVKMLDVKFNVKELILPATSILPMALNTNDYSDIIKMNVEGDGTLSLDMSDLIPPTEELSIGLSFKPVAEAGYSFDNWNVMGSTYLPNSKIKIDTSDFEKGDIVDIYANYKLVEASEIAQTSDATPFAAGVVVVVAAMAGIAVIALRKQH